MALTLEKFVKKTLDLIEKERQAEIDEKQLLQEHVPVAELQRRGLCLLRLKILNKSTGYYGRTVLKLGSFWPGRDDLPAHKFTPGDIAGLQLDGDVLASGVILKVAASAISIAFDENIDINLHTDKSYRLTKLTNNVTYKRMKRALNALWKDGNERLSLLIGVLFGSKPAPPMSTRKPLEFFNTNLDSSQQSAAEFALNQRDLAIVHGPPGTGKTTTVIEIIRQAIQNGHKILACAPSNIAVDNLVERLAVSERRLLRLGHPARLLDSIQRFSLDAVISRSDEADVTQAVRTDLDKALSKLATVTDRGAKTSLRKEVGLLRKDLREAEEVATKRALLQADVVLATLTSASRDGPLKHIPADYFNMVVIDECSQSVEAGCWQALLQAPKCVLAGDHKQLPPTIVCREAAEEGLALSLMERQVSLHGDSAVRMLTTQYRMNELISNWASEQLYDSRLTSHSSVQHHLLKDLPGIADTEDTQTPLLLIDTTGCSMHELNTNQDVSRGNEGEVELVAAHVDSLVKAGLRPVDIAIITPYNLQVELLRLRLLPHHPGLEINSVDGFQGREKEAVVISLVRSNDAGQVGFLAEDRRINVAVTRARRHLALVTDCDTVGHHKFLETLIDYMTEYGDVRSAQQYIQDGRVNLDSKRSDYLEAKMSTVRIEPDTKPVAKKKPKQKVHLPKQEYSKQKEFSQKITNVNRDDKSEREMSDDENSEMDVLADDIITFMSSKETEHTFPNTLTPRQRFHVHELAEEFGLIHLSQGEGSDRYIVVRKHQVGEELIGIDIDKSVQKDSTGASSNSCKDTSISGNGKGKCTTMPDESVSLPDEPSNVPDSDVIAICDKCDKFIPNANRDLHMLRCPGPKQPQAKISKPKPKSKNKKSALAAACSQNGEEDFDSLIEAAMKDNSVCAFKKCKQGTITLGQNCEFCSRRYCLSHHIPEVHGCGDAVKSQARQQISRDGVLYRGSGVPSKKCDPVKRAHLQRKLDKKLDALNDKRTTNKKDKT